MRRLPTCFITLLTTLTLAACGGGSSDKDKNKDKQPTTDSACQNIDYTPVNQQDEVGIDPLLDSQEALQALGLLSSTWDWLTDKTGKGVTIAVLDNNLDYEHPDLYANINHAQSCHFEDSKRLNTHSHATQVTGVIAAERNNNLGMAGIAPEAEIIGFNILRTDSKVRDWNIALGGEGTYQAAGVDIFNQSFNDILNTQPEEYNLNIDAAMAYGTTYRRDGKGALYFKAAGNFFDGDESCYSSGRSLPLENANMDPDNNIPYNMVVGALDSRGDKACYSASGSSLLFVAPGSFLRTTADGSGYTFFSGTSAATPVASAIAALILETNPNLGWRDVRHILLSTATQIAIDKQPEHRTLQNGQYIVEPSWQNNGAGYPYHNWYGFGQLNPIAALEAAQSYTHLLPTQQLLSSETRQTDSTIPDFSVLGASDSLTLDQALIVESVQLDIQLSHTKPADLAIELISPSGSHSLLMTPENRYQARSTDNFQLRLTSQLFYGEPAEGLWTLKVVDTQHDHKSDSQGRLIDWSLHIYGH